MTKGELLKLLEPYSADQYVYVGLHSKDYPRGSMVIIQGVKDVPPWHEGPPNLICLLAHSDNKIL